MTGGRAAAVLTVVALVAACTGGDDARDETAGSGPPPTTTADSTVPAAGSTSAVSTSTTPETSPGSTAGTSPDDGTGGPADEPTGDVDPGGELGPPGSTDVDVTTDLGRVQIGDADLPDTLPAGFPVPDDLAVELASDIGTQSGFSGVTDLAFDEVVELYRDGLAELGFDVRETRFVDGVVAVFEFTGPSGSGNVAIGSAPGGGRSVLVTYER